MFTLYFAFLRSILVSVPSCAICNIVCSRRRYKQPQRDAEDRQEGRSARALLCTVCTHMITPQTTTTTTTIQHQSRKKGRGLPYMTSAFKGERKVSKSAPNFTDSEGKQNFSKFIWRSYMEAPRWEKEEGEGMMNAPKREEGGQKIDGKWDRRAVALSVSRWAKRGIAGQKGRVNRWQCKPAVISML